jgi:hypothetical protein
MINVIVLFLCCFAEKREHERAQPQGVSHPVGKKAQNSSTFPGIHHGKALNLLCNYFIMSCLMKRRNLV